MDSNTETMIRLRRIANRTATFLLVLSVCFAALPASTLACTGIYAGSSSTENGSAYIGRSEDYGPDYGKQFIIVSAADHAEGEGEYSTEERRLIRFIAGKTGVDDEALAEMEQAIGGQKAIKTAED